MARKNKRGSGGKQEADPAQQQRLLPPHPGPPKVPQPAFYNENFGPPLGPPVDANGIVVGQWATGLCACWDHCVPNCLMAALLPFVSLAQIASRLGIARFGNAMGFFFTLTLVIIICSVVDDVVAMGELLDDDDPNVDWLFNGTNDAPSNLSVGELIFIYVLQVLQSTASVVLFLSTWQLRANVRERFRIPGGCVDDCCSVFWLSCCVIAQMATHIKSYRPGTCDFGPVDTLPAYDYGNKSTGKDDSGLASDVISADAKEPSGAYQLYTAEEREEKEDEDEDEEMKRMRAVDAPNMRYM